MKIHPSPKKRTFPNPKTMSTHHQKKLRKLPHIFSRVLELPFSSDADVSIEESSDLFRFVFPVTENNLCGGGEDGVRAHAVEIHPGIVKIVIKGFLRKSDDEMRIHMWRYRLPASTRPEMVSVACDGGQLVVIVPKIGQVNEDEEENWGRLVTVQ